MKIYTNLIFKGGGVKGVAYAGAIQQLDTMGILPDIKRVAGTSAGAITATLLAMGYSSAEIEDIAVNEMDFKSFMDKSGLPGNVYRFLKAFGWYKGDAFKTWLGNIIKKKTGSEHTTFKDLKTLAESQPDSFRELYVVATNLNRQYPEIFSVEENINTPIVNAVRMSMSIPLFFKSVSWNGFVMVDGGMGYNYPIDLFDSRKYVKDTGNIETRKLEQGDIEINKETLGLWLDTREGIDNLRNRIPRSSRNINNLKTFAFSMVDYLMEMANMAHLEEYDWDRSILIDSLDVKATDFDGVKARAADLVESSKKGVIEYFKTVNT